MAGREGSQSPIPSAEEENHYDRDEDNNMEHDEQRAQENDDETMSDQDREPDSYINHGRVSESVTETSVGGENNVVLPNFEDETDGAEALEDAEIMEPAQGGLGYDIMMEDPDASPDLEEELGGVIIGEIENANGLVDLLVMSVDSSTGTPEL